MVFSAYWHRKKVFIKRLSILVQLDRLTISRRLTNRLYTRRPQLPPTALQTWRPNPPVIAPTCSSSLTSSNSLLCCLRAPFVLFHFYSHYKTLSNLMPGEVSGRQFVKKKKEEKHNNKHVDNVPRAYHFGHTQLWKAMCRAHCSHSHKKKQDRTWWVILIFNERSSMTVCLNAISPGHLCGESLDQNYENSPLLETRSIKLPGRLITRHGRLPMWVQCDALSC